MITGYTPEGIGYAVRRAGSAVGYCALSIGCGTRDEGEFPSGIAHFTEHTVFKGTAHRSARSINSCLEMLGGELNAFTTKEETVIHATVLKNDLSRALRLLLELATEPSFPEDEIEIEKGVVIEEIQSYKDNPADDIYDCFEEMFFKGHPLSGLILGTEESVKSITPEHLRAYSSGSFRPERMVFSMVADISEEKMVAMIQRVCSRLSGTRADCHLERGGCHLEHGGCHLDRAQRVEKSPVPQYFNDRIRKDNHEANAVYGGYAPSLGEGRSRLVAGLLANVIGGPASNSILGNVLREKNGWVYGVEASYTPYSDSGIMAISLGCDPLNLEKVERTVHRELHKICDAPMAARTFASVKKQLLGQMAVSTANGEAECLGLGKSMLAFGYVLSDEAIRETVTSIKAEEMRAMAERIFTPGKYSSLIFI